MKGKFFHNLFLFFIGALSLIYAARGHEARGYLYPSVYVPKECFTPTRAPVKGKSFHNLFTSFIGGTSLSSAPRRHKVCGYIFIFIFLFYFVTIFNFGSAMPNKPIREKKHRLFPEMYTGERIIAFTGNVKNRKSLFTNKQIFMKFEEFLLDSLSKFECDAYVYLFMPNHFHFILSGQNADSNIKKCIDSFKQISGFWLSENIPNIKWQKDYYDHILRSNEDLTTRIRYILNNPVRAGIVDYWKQCKFRGSTIYNFDEWT